MGEKKRTYFSFKKSPMSRYPPPFEERFLTGKVDLVLYKESSPHAWEPLATAGATLVKGSPFRAGVRFLEKVSLKKISEFSLLLFLWCFFPFFSGFLLVFRAFVGPCAPGAPAAFRMHGSLVIGCQGFELADVSLAVLLRQAPQTGGQTPQGHL